MTGSTTSRKAQAWEPRCASPCTGVVVSELSIGQHVSDIAVHGWDIARATGQTADFDSEVAEVGLEWARENLKPQFRGQAFGPEVSASPDAPPYDRLADFFLQVGGLRTGHAVLSKLTINGEA